VVAVGGLLTVINENLAMINNLRGEQQRRIDEGEAAVRFWQTFGGEPTRGVWDTWDRRALGPAARAEKSLVGSNRYPYVADVNLDALRRNLSGVVHGYQGFMHFIEAARRLATIEEHPIIPDYPNAAQRAQAGQVRYYTMVSAPDRAMRRRYDITDVVAPIRDAAYAELDHTARERGGALTADQRRQIYRLRNGAETAIYVTANNRWAERRVISAQRTFGPDPWVRIVGAEKDVGGFLRTDVRVPVVPANADAERAAAFAAYWVQLPIDEVFEEVTAHHRPILDRQPPTGRIIESFVAGPLPGSTRFGDTRYHRHPDPGTRMTAAIGELNQFWVDRDDLWEVPSAEVEGYVHPR
jgi:hypothetical protein